MHDKVIAVGRELVKCGHLRRQVTFASYVSLGRLTRTTNVLVGRCTQEIDDEVQLYNATNHKSAFAN